jgi:hypothetical protein
MRGGYAYEDIQLTKTGWLVSRGLWLDLRMPFYLDAKVAGFVQLCLFQVGFARIGTGYLR